MPICRPSLSSTFHRRVEPYGLHGTRPPASRNTPLVSARARFALESRNLFVASREATKRSNAHSHREVFSILPVRRRDGLTSSTFLHRSSSSSKPCNFLLDGRR